MKKILSRIAVCLLAAQLSAAAGQWLTSMPEAKAQAKKENKLILLDFTGSDWCPWCKKMDAESLSQKAFLDYAKSNLVLVEVDFPASIPQSSNVKAANDALKTQYKVSGFPTLVLAKADGTAVWTQEGYLEGGPSALIAGIEKARKR